MKILFYAHSSTLYGANRSLIELVLGLKSINPQNEIYVILPNNGPLKLELEKNEIAFKVIPQSNWIYNYDTAQRWKNRGEIFWIMWFYKNKISKNLQNSRRLGIHINMVKNFSPDVIYVNSSLAPMGVLVAEELNIPFLWHHRETVNDRLTGFYLNSTSDFQKHYNQAKTHLYSSKFLEKYYNQYFGERNSTVVFNGILTDATTKKRNEFNPRKIRFGMVGRLNKQKGQREVITIFKKMNNISEEFPHELHLYGGGIQNYLNLLKAGTGDKNIFFHNFTKRNKIYQALDFLIVNSTNEAFGRVIAEANFYGIPVLARNSGALPEIIMQNKNGWIYNNHEELEKIILNIIETINSSNYLKYSEKALHFSKSNFDLETYSKTILEIFKKTAKTNNSVV